MLEQETVQKAVRRLGRSIIAPVGANFTSASAGIQAPQIHSDDSLLDDEVRHVDPCLSQRNPENINAFKSFNSPAIHGETTARHQRDILQMTQKMEKVKSPAALAHVVLRTQKFEEMLDFYVNFLGAEITARNGNIIAFLRYDSEHHRVALISLPPDQPEEGAANGEKGSSQPQQGMHHMSFSFDSLADLTQAYRQRRALGIKPVWCVNHGPTTSIYYRDPDANIIETQVDNFDTPEAANKFMESKAFRENPVGADFDPEMLMTRLQSGEDLASIKRRPEIGPRMPMKGF